MKNTLIWAEKIFLDRNMAKHSRNMLIYMHRCYELICIRSTVVTESRWKCMYSSFFHNGGFSMILLEGDGNLFAENLHILYAWMIFACHMHIFRWSKFWWKKFSSNQLSKKIYCETFAYSLIIRTDWQYKFEKDHVDMIVSLSHMCIYIFSILAS